MIGRSISNICNRGGIFIKAWSAKVNIPPRSYIEGMDRPIILYNTIYYGVCATDGPFAWKRYPKQHHFHQVRISQIWDHLTMLKFLWLYNHYAILIFIVSRSAWLYISNHAQSILYCCYYILLYWFLTGILGTSAEGRAVPSAKKGKTKQPQREASCTRQSKSKPMCLYTEPSRSLCAWAHGYMYMHVLCVKMCMSLCIVTWWSQSGLIVSASCM